MRRIWSGCCGLWNGMVGGDREMNLKNRILEPIVVKFAAKVM